MNPRHVFWGTVGLVGIWAGSVCAQEPPPEIPAEAPTMRMPARGGLELEEAVRRALEQNIEIAIERIAPEITATTVVEAEAAFDVNTNAAVEYSESSNPRSSEQQAADGLASTESRQMDVQVGVDKQLSTGTEIGLTGRTNNTQSTFNQFEDEYNSFAGITFRHPLLKNSGVASNRFQIRSAEKRTEADLAAYRDRVEGIILRVHNAYYELLFAYADYESKQKALATAERLMVDNQNRYELGTMTPLDVSQARSEVSQRMSDLLLAELEINQRQLELKRLIFRDMGDQMDQPVVLGDTLPDPESLPSPGFNINAGLQNRQDLKSLLTLAERSGLEITFRKNQLFPQLDLSAEVGFRGRDEDFTTTVENIGEARDESWGVGLSITFPWGVRAEKARLKRSELEQERLLLQIKDKENEIIQEISNAYQEAENARLRHINDRRARLISLRTAQAEEEKLREGISTSFTVLQLQRDATAARTRELRSLVNYYRGLIQLRRSQGLLLADHGFRLPEAETTGSSR